MISQKVTVFVTEAQRHPGMSSFNLDNFNTSFPTLVPVIEKSMDSWADIKNAELIIQMEDLQKKNEIAIHNLDKLQTLTLKDSVKFDEVCQIINSTLSVIK